MSAIVAGMSNTTSSNVDQALAMVVAPPRPLGPRQQERTLAGKVALITGGSRGIGKRAALALARCGAKVVVAARSVQGNGELAGTIGETVSEVAAFGGEALAVATDLSREDELERLVQTAVDRFGGIDILINNAAVTIGHSWVAPVGDMPRADWLYHFAVNLHAPFTLVQLVVPLMEQRGGGRILNVTTGSGEVFRQPEEPPVLEAVGDFDLGSPAYFASKRALDRFSNVIAPHLARKNIFVISMHPGFVATEVAVHRVAGLVDESMMISPEIPARMLAYFAACADPKEYAGRIFWAERELAELGIEL
jgi:NAD(P)-dependent dehydrogenase (short-subunit alcohol dehydrogenase family)